jgi:hypothetical protein
MRLHKIQLPGSGDTIGALRVCAAVEKFLNKQSKHA